MKILEHVRAPFAVTKAFDEGDNFTIEGYASTFGNVDLQGDVVDQGAFVDSIAHLEAQATAKGTDALMPMLFNHSPDAPIGVFTHLAETDKGLFSRASLPKSDTFVAGRVVPQVKRGSLKGLSIGFYTDERDHRDGHRHITKATLVETSLVTFAANPLAEITSAKGQKLTVDDIEDCNLVELERILKAGTPCSRQAAKYLVHAVSALRKAGAADPDDQRDAGLLDGATGDQIAALAKAVAAFAGH